MNIVNKLTLRHLKENKGRTLVTTFGIIVSVAMITAVFVAMASFLQLFADVLGVPVEISKASELGAMGVAMEAAVGTGLYPDIKSAVSDWVKIKAIYQPNPEKVKFYEKKYQVYKKIIYQLDSIWGELDGLEEK